MAGRREQFSGMTMDKDALQAYFEDEAVLDLYGRATANIGLWHSEEMVFQKYFQPEDRILEIGCGTGRIALGLHELGYRHLLGIDLSRGMVKRARHLATVLEYPVSFQVGDATRLKFDDGLFDGAIFGFNGLMQIPGRAARRRALSGIRRVVRPGGYFVFTTHDRDHFSSGESWEAEAARWETGRQDPALEEFGDRIVQSPIGTYYIHIPSSEEIAADLVETGWDLRAHAMRSEIVNEPAEVREFSDDCRFWAARHPQAE